MRRTFQCLREHQEELLFVVALAFGLAAVLQSALRLSFHNSLLIAIPVAGLLVAAFSWLLARRLRRQNRPVRVQQHPEFGEVWVFRDRWVVDFSGSPFTRRVEVSGRSAAELPSEEQAAVFAEIAKRFSELFVAATDELAGELRMLKPPAKPDELVLSSIWIEDRPGRSEFSFAFVLLSRPKDFPDGLYVDFVGFQVEEAGVVY